MDISRVLQEPLESDLPGAAFLHRPGPESSPSSEHHSSYFLSSSLHFHHVRSFAWLVIAPDVGIMCLEQEALCAPNTLPAPLILTADEDDQSCRNTSFAHPSSDTFGFSLALQRIHQLPRGGCCGHGWNNVKTVF